MTSRIFMVLFILSCLSILSAEAGITAVPPGGTVFIGEEHLDISASGIGPGSQIAWWAPGTSVEDTPADVVTVSNPSSFSAMSSSFSEREGIWYSLTGKTPVMKIKQPKISLRITDTTSDFDATGKWFPRGHLASFQIETNMHEIGNRGDGSGVPVDIIIKSPGGSEYSSVSGPSGSFSLTGIPIRSSSYDTGPVWNTGDTDVGTYEIHAECTANRINDNNADPGAGVSQTITVLIQGVNPLITGGKGKEEPDGEETTVPTVTAPEISPTPVPTVSLPVPSVSLPVPQQPQSPAEGNQTLAEPLPVSASSNITAIPATTPPTPVPTPKTPSPTPQTPLCGLIAILAVSGLIVRTYR